MTTIECLHLIPFISLDHIPYSGYFSGNKVSWILKVWRFVEKISWLNHTPYTREVEMASYFKVEAMVRGYHQYKEIWEAEVGEQLATADSLIKNPHA